LKKMLDLIAANALSEVAACLSEEMQRLAYIHDIYINELVKGVFLPETRRQLLAIVERLANERRVEGLILAGTELPLMLREATCGISFLDTTPIHAKAALRRLLS
jgi:aspartate racemase